MTLRALRIIIKRVIKMSLAERLKARLAELGMNQKELAKNLNISYTTLNGYFTGYREPDFHTLMLLANNLDCTVAYLLGEIDIPKPKITVDLKEPIILIDDTTPPNKKSEKEENNNDGDSDLVIIHRLHKKLSPVDKEKFMKLLRIQFAEDFPDEDNDDGVQK